MPFATASAINTTLFNIRKPLIGKIRLRQKSKKPWWNNRKYGIRITKAHKRQRVISGQIGTSAYFAELWEKGGVKHPYHAKNIAIPTGKIPMKYKKSGGARAFIQDKKTFKIGEGIYHRKGKKGKIERAFTLKKSAVIHPGMGFVLWAHRYVSRSFAKNHRAAMARALRTAR